ncbi:unnamed protein product [Phytomonas sp. EM1]|nr:unnamed protein product [Phytomonas sp. EM1]|eukprot:CCW65472.1 unnamed protein product [Phytomonas sp. isolate EM1]
MSDLDFSQITCELANPPDQELSIEDPPDPLDLTSVLIQQQTRISRLWKALLDVTQMCVLLLDKDESANHQPHGVQQASHMELQPDCVGYRARRCEDGATPKLLEADELEYVLPQWLREPKCRASIAASIKRHLGEATQTSSSAILEFPHNPTRCPEPPSPCSTSVKVKPIIMVDVTSMFSCIRGSPDDLPSSRSGRRMKDASIQVELSSVADRPAFSPSFPPEEVAMGHRFLASQNEQREFLKPSWNAALEKVVSEKSEVERLEIERSRALNQCEELRYQLDQAQHALLEQKHRQEREANRVKEELHRLRVLMRFSELKKDSDRLPDVLANLQEATQQQASLERQNARLRVRQQGLQRCVEMTHAWTRKAILAAETGSHHNEHTTYWARLGPNIVSRIHELCGEALEGKESHAEGDDRNLHAAVLSGAGHARRVSRSVLDARGVSMFLAPPKDAATESISKSEGDAIPVKKASAVAVIRGTKTRPELVRSRPCSSIPRLRGSTRSQSACMRW